MKYTQSDAVLGLNDDVRRNNYANLAALTVLLYDHMLTSEAEVTYIWSWPLKFSSLWFLAFRYFALFGNIAITILDYISTTDRQCNYYHVLHHVCMFVVQVVVGTILVIRTYALYCRDKRVLVGLLTVGAALIGLSVWGLIGQEGTLLVIPGEGCQVSYDHATSLHIAVPWECQLALDTLVFALTFLKTYHPVLHSRNLASATPSGSVAVRRYIYHVLLRDGALYYGCMCIANFANTLTFYIGGPIFRGGLSRVASSISTLMTSRLVLNLHETAAINDGPSSGMTTQGRQVHGGRSGLAFALSAISSDQSQSGTETGLERRAGTDKEDGVSSRFEPWSFSTRARTGTDVEKEPRYQWTSIVGDVMR